MPRLTFDEAIDKAVAEAMAEDDRVLLFGEDVHMLHPGLYARFGADRVLPAPISEAAFVGAAVGASMAGLRPICELMMVDFVAVAFDAVLNHMAKVEVFSGGSWRCPLVVRAPCGGGYGDGGQHGQALWGMLAGVPGITVCVPSNPRDAAGLMASAIDHDGPVFFMEHKLLSESWLDFLGRGGRSTVSFDVPRNGAEGYVEEPVERVSLGTANVVREGTDLTILSLAVGLHRAMVAAQKLKKQGIEAEVIDLRTVSPLDTKTICASVEKTGHVLVVDEDYERFGLSGELAATLLEQGLRPAFGRVCVKDTMPYARKLEHEALPNVDRILDAAAGLVKKPGIRR